MDKSRKDEHPSTLPSAEEGGLTYHAAGVDIEKANEAKNRIKRLARSTFGPCVMSDIGAFAGLYRPDLSGFQKPVLVSSVDGVGTKLKIAFMTNIHSTVGIDIVAHCTNDILVQGSVPLFFLDYIATGRLEPGVVEQIVSGLAEGCRQSQCALLGGETAEMPDFYQPGEYDLAGFIVGIADESRLLSSSRVAEGDILIGLPSSGLHTNGYSLVRKLVFEQEKLSLDHYVGEFGRTLGEELLIPHRNYLGMTRKLILGDGLNAVAHITGGGITGNLARVLPDFLDALVECSKWEVLPIFDFVRRRGKVALDEMFRTFNMGLGMILVVSQEQTDQVSKHLESLQEPFFLIGEVTKGSGKVVYA